MSKIDYNNRKFRPVQSSSNSEVGEETIFVYKQKGNVLTCEYQGGQIQQGHLIGLVNEHGKIEMRYHQLNAAGQLMTGMCTSIPEIMENGKIRLHEDWTWTSGDLSKGSSILEEL